jgi:hypothetical protein
MSTTIATLDKIYYNLIKEYPEDYVVSLINNVVSYKLIPYIQNNLIINNYKTIEILYEGIRKNKEFTKLLKDNIINIVISAVRHKEAMQVAMRIYNDIPFSRFTNKFNGDMLICIYRHGIKYPENMELCIECIKPHLTEDIVIVQPFFFIKDEINIVPVFFNKNKSAKDYVFTHCVDCDAVKIFSKALKYYKLQNYHYVILSFPAFKDNLDKIDLSDPETREKIIDDVTTYSRWDFLPFIFENMELTERDWIHFRIGLYQGFFNSIFMEVLLFCFKKYKISFSNLKTAKKLTCTKGVKDVLVKYGFDNQFDIKVSVIHIDNIKKDICNLFHHFCDKEYEYIIFYMYTSYAHLNGRFLRERDYVDNLIKQEGFGFDSTIKIKWIAFMAMTSSLIEELRVTDIMLIKYNSYIASSASMQPIMANCFVNDIYREITKLKTKSLIEEYATVVLSIRNNGKSVLKEIRSMLGIDLEPEKDWNLPLNPTLEDLFMEIYQYGCYNENENPEEAYKLSVELKEKKCYKIMEEIQMALELFVPLDSIKKILRFKGVIP